MEVSIVIVSYNGKEFLKNCIASIINSVSNKTDYEIIIVDNNSSDNSAEMVEKEFREIKLIANKQNLGFSRANNQGIKISQKGKYILFLNPDTVMQKNTLKEMIKFMDAHRDAGAATCKLIMPNGKADDASHR